MVRVYCKASLKLTKDEDYDKFLTLKFKAKIQGQKFYRRYKKRLTSYGRTLYHDHNCEKEFYEEVESYMDLERIKSIVAEQMLKVFESKRTTKKSLALKEKIKDFNDIEFIIDL